MPDLRVMLSLLRGSCCCPQRRRCCSAVACGPVWTGASRRSRRRRTRRSSCAKFGRRRSATDRPFAIVHICYLFRRSLAVGRAIFSSGKAFCLLLYVYPSASCVETRTSVRFCFRHNISTSAAADARLGTRRALRRHARTGSAAATCRPPPMPTTRPTTRCSARHSTLPSIKNKLVSLSRTLCPGYFKS